jgi:Tfp pilus assembly protein PilZ
VYCLTVPWIKGQAAARDSGLAGKQRIALCERCEFELAGTGAFREGVVWNLSAVGLYLVVRTDIPPLGAAVTVRLWLPGDPRPLQVETEVVWCNPPSPVRGCGAKALRFPPGCGVKFVEISADDQARIRARVAMHP